MVESDSQWFKGYTEKYFIDRGVTTRKLMGKAFSCLYALYFSIFKYSRYKADISFVKAFYNMTKGIFSSKK